MTDHFAPTSGHSVQMNNDAVQVKYDQERHNVLIHSLNDTKLKRLVFDFGGIVYV